MTRKDYVAIAQIISGHTHEVSIPHKCSERIAIELANLFERDNPPNGHGGGFNRQKFLQACGLNEEDQ